MFKRGETDQIPTEGLERMMRSNNCFSYLSDAVFLWRRNRRPYVNVFPAVEKMLLNTKIESIDPGTIEQTVLHSIETVEVRFASQRRPFFLTVTPKKETFVAKVGAIEAAFYGGEVAMRMQRQLFGCKKVHVVDSEKMMQVISLDVGEWMDLSLDMLRIGVGIMMLASDPFFFIPAITKRDQERALSGKQLIDAVERSKRRGNIGFNVGRDVEVCPHFRRPHFAMRWTGKGRETPRLVPVKGSIVHRAGIAVPTGYEG